MSFGSELPTPDQNNDFGRSNEPVTIISPNRGNFNTNDLYWHLLTSIVKCRACQSSWAEGWDAGGVYIGAGPL